MEIKRELTQWDGKSVEMASLIYQEHHFESYFIDQLIALCQDKKFEVGATWLLKHHFEAGEQLTESEIAQIYTNLAQLHHWEAKLHILQIIPYMPIAPMQKETVEQFIRHCLADRNKFLRAWAYNALYVLSQQYAEYLLDVKKLFKIALKKEAPSIKARIKNILLSNQSP